MISELFTVYLHVLHVRVAVVVAVVVVAVVVAV